MKQRRYPSRSGQSLVEFAVVALVLYMLLAAILTFGHALYVAQGLQGAADLAAREISRTPLSASTVSLDRDDGSVQYAMSDDAIRTRIYDIAYLVIDLDVFYSQNVDGNIFTDIVPSLPLLNQQLVPLMIVDRPVIAGVERHLLRYPGALLSPATPAMAPPGMSYAPWVETNLSVGIPLIKSDGSIQWLDVVEEIESGNSNPFDVANANTNGVVALRMNYPFQSASMSGYQPNPVGPFEPTIGNPIVADNSIIAPTPPNGTPITQDLVNPGPNPTYTGIYGGNLGLGAQGAQGRIVRPFRRVISAQAIYRREVFGP